MALKLLKLFVLPLAVFALTGCATYQSKVAGARLNLERGQFQQALDILEPLATQTSDDQLAYLLDYATALQVAGRHEESTAYFLQADKLAELKDYHSLSRIGGSLLFSEEMVQYKGEDYEKLLINVMTAINFILQGNRESALVEVRRLNEKLEYYRIEEKKEYQHNSFALYLSALLWEADRNWDSAFIDYMRAYTIEPRIPYLTSDLRALARLTDRQDEIKKIGVDMSGVEVRNARDRSMGEVVLIYQQGWGPEKAPRPDSPRFPTLKPVWSQTVAARLQVEDGPQEVTQVIYSVVQNSIRTLNEKYDALVAKRLAGFVAKEVVAKQISDDNQLLGLAALITMHASDRADLRQWSTLPQSFQIARIRLKPGKYMVSAKGLSSAGFETGEVMPAQPIEVKGGEKVFVGWRSFR